MDLIRFQKLRILVLWIAVPIVLAPLFFIRSAWEDQLLFHFDIDILIQIGGLALILIAIGGRVWCSLYIGGRKSTSLVTDGPYSISRNPLYLFSILGAVGVGAQTGSLIIAFLVGMLVYLVFSITAAREERFLTEAFGEDYLEYKVRVPSIFPVSLNVESPNSVDFKPRFAARTLGDSAYFLLALPVLNGIEHLQDLGILTNVLMLY